MKDMIISCLVVAGAVAVIIVIVYVLYVGNQHKLKSDREYAEYQRRVATTCENRGGLAIWDENLRFVVQCVFSPPVTPEAK